MTIKIVVCDQLVIVRDGLHPARGEARHQRHRRYPPVASMPSCWWRMREQGRFDGRDRQALPPSQSGGRIGVSLT